MNKADLLAALSSDFWLELVKKIEEELTQLREDIISSDLSTSEGIKTTISAKDHMLGLQKIFQIIEDMKEESK